VPDDRDRARLAREALARAKADALARGVRPARPQDNGPQRAGTPEPGPSRRPGRRARRDDPEPLNAAIDGLIDAQGWREAAAVGSVFGRWAQIVGPDLAAHTRPDSLADRELTVTADSTAWATQVRLLAPQLVRRLNAELGDGSVQRVKVRGPASASGPARRPGEWRVRGGRGPRDTYG
jgi:predicted nucleic acid-binding Zn ribbon protein